MSNPSIPDQKIQSEVSEKTVTFEEARSIFLAFITTQREYKGSRLFDENWEYIYVPASEGGGSGYSFEGYLPLSSGDGGGIEDDYDESYVVDVWINYDEWHDPELHIIYEQELCPNSDWGECPDDCEGNCDQVESVHQKHVTYKITLDEGAVSDV